MFRWLLYPISIIYGLIVSTRNYLFDFNLLKSKEFALPIISIGNITVGGTGKTPHVEYLIRLLKNSYKVATLSRGYKRKTRGFILADGNATVREIGDEPKQIKDKFTDIRVAVDTKRVRGVKKLMGLNEDLDVVVLDDAFQHRAIKPGLSILLIDYYRPIDKDYLLPYGMLRESMHEKSRANLILVTKTPKDIKPIDRRIMIKNISPFPYQNVYFTSLNYGNFLPVFKGSSVVFNQSLLKTEPFSILLLTGIANPASFRNYLDSFSKEIIHIEFSDHHNYKKTDIIKVKKTLSSITNPKKIIVTTEKDAVRLRESTYIDDEIKKNIYYIPIEIEFTFNDQNEFNNQIITYVRKDKTNYRLHSTKSKL